VVGAIYDIEHGSVHWLGEHPAQEAILAAAGTAPAVDADTPAAEETGEEHGGQAPVAEAAPTGAEAPAAEHGAAAEEESGSALPIVLFVVGLFGLIAVMQKTVLKE